LLLARPGREGPKEYADLCKQYGVHAVTGDKYAKEWVQRSWRDLLGAYNEAKLYAWELYLESLAPFNRGLVELPPDLALVRELKSLQRVAARSGKESVEHPRGSHDDLANAVAGCLHLLSKPERQPFKLYPHPDLTKVGYVYSAPKIQTRRRTVAPVRQCRRFDLAARRRRWQILGTCIGERG
jgi:hypothetical protein